MNTTSKTEGTGRRAAKKQITVAEYLTQQIILCGKSQTQIAKEVGFNKSNIISMIKSGSTNLPMAKIAVMSKSLGIDPIHLFKLVMQEYEPETWEAIEDKILQQPVITQNELEIIELIRQGAVENPKIRTNEERKRILDAVATLRPDNSHQSD